MRQYYNYFQEISQDQKLTKAILYSLIFGIPKPHTKPICESTDQEWRHYLVSLFAELKESSTVAPFETLMIVYISKIIFTRKLDQILTSLQWLSRRVTAVRKILEEKTYGVVPAAEIKNWEIILKK